MNAEFRKFKKNWIRRWKDREIGFHGNEINPLLKNHFHSLNIHNASKVFIPLCGKSLDISWLLSEGYYVVGVELSEDAVKELFEELGLTPVISKTDDFIEYKTNNVCVFAGDIFNLSFDLLGTIDAIYDRAALVALPKEVRIEYARHLIRITKVAPQLLISYEYDQKLMSVSPFSVDSSEIAEHYNNHYSPSLLEKEDIKGGLKGEVDAKQTVWLLQ